MTIKTKTTFEGILTKLFYICIPFILSGIVYMASTVYDIKSQQQIIKVDNDATKNMQEKIYQKVEQNFTILQSKADEKSNTEEHTLIMNKLDKMDVSFRKHTMYGESIYIKDTIYLPVIMPEKPKNNFVLNK